MENIKLSLPGGVLPWIRLFHCDCPDELVKCFSSSRRQGDARRCRFGDVARPPHHRRVREKVVQGDPGNRLRWCLLPLKDMVGSSWWPVRPATLSVLSPTPVLRFLPKTNKTWKDEFPNDVFWLCQVRHCLQKLLFHSNSKFLFSSVIHCLNKCVFLAM